MSKKLAVHKSISAEDIKTYSEKNSDFAFEMKALQILSRLQYGCEHVGTYRDPATGKAREFDIRAINYRGSNYGIFPIECKNIREHNPLVIHAVRRPMEDSFHHIIARPSHEQQLDSSLQITNFGDGFRTIEVKGQKTRYLPLGIVGKHIDQVSNQGEGVEKLRERDDGVFEKFNQALSSSGDLVKRAIDFVQKKRCWIASVIPVMVVPDGLLWVIEYNDSGEIVADPKQVSDISILVRHSLAVPSISGSGVYTISHAEIVTLTGLSKMMAEICSSGIFA